MERKVNLITKWLLECNRISSHKLISNNRDPAGRPTESALCHLKETVWKRSRVSPDWLSYAASAYTYKVLSSRGSQLRGVLGGRDLRCQPPPLPKHTHMHTHTHALPCQRTLCMLLFFQGKYSLYSSVGNIKHWSPNHTHRGTQSTPHTRTHTHTHTQRHRHTHTDALWNTKIRFLFYMLKRLHRHI